MSTWVLSCPKVYVGYKVYKWPADGLGLTGSPIIQRYREKQPSQAPILAWVDILRTGERVGGGGGGEKN